MRAWMWSRPLGAVLFSISLVVASLAAEQAQATSVDFEGLGHGEVANGAQDGVQVDALNLVRDFDLAVGFDTMLSGTADLDLEMGSGWTRGNIADEQLGMILILQENDLGCGSGICSSPDDERARPAGDLIFSFETALLDFGFDLVDIGDAMVEAGSVEFFDGALSVEIPFSAFLDSSSAYYDPSVEFGNNSANRIAPLSAEMVGFRKFDAVTIHLGGSGGVDNLTGTIVPEPSTAVLALLGLIGLASVGRRR